MPTCIVGAGLLCFSCDFHSQSWYLSMGGWLSCDLFWLDRSDSACCSRAQLCVKLCPGFILGRESCESSFERWRRRPFREGLFRTRRDAVLRRCAVRTFLI